ncbi:X8 domain-containing protein [Heracleum sosnowskyi]|uniref:X8 domain-containing protein n=1 Tax=Heracleum sosnowskyi TaxID=360622 RepID=A0AAD8HH12_9APIA|nr:X8 domain-containing protein [Heracleum sosnowskyi]
MNWRGVTMGHYERMHVRLPGVALAHAYCAHEDYVMDLWKRNGEKGQMKVTCSPNGDVYEISTSNLSGVGEVGCPTEGDRNANTTLAQRFNQGFMTNIAGGKGTPMINGLINVYMFSLIDEDEKSVQPGYFERYWGKFTYDGLSKYGLNLGTTNSGVLVLARNYGQNLERKWCVMKPSTSLDDPHVAQNVSYARGLADYTCLGYGTSCGNLDKRRNISYAFKSYYQKNNQPDTACKFPGLSMIT